MMNWDANFPPIPANGKGHVGLWFNKWCPELDDEKAKAEFLLALANWRGNVAELSDYQIRQDALLASVSRHSRVADFKLDAASGSRFLVGLGNPHPLENGMTWHHTLTVPYLCGAALKGMLNAWLRDWCGDVALADSWCGTEDRAGDLIFFDALPVDPPTMVKDLVNPHMGKWGENAPSNSTYWDHLPADWHMPVPSFFLAVAQITLRVRIAIAPRATSLTAADLDTAKSHLAEAFASIGAGTKTAVGYGRFTPV